MKIPELKPYSTPKKEGKETNYLKKIAKKDNVCPPIEAKKLTRKKSS